MKRLTQSQRVLKYLNDFGSITSLEAYRDLGIIQLPRRIYDLRQSGINIKSDWQVVINRYNEKTQIKRFYIGE